MTIGEISEKTNLPESTLRYYEKMKLIKVIRDKNGRRDYADSDVEWIKFIRRLKETGMLLKDIQQYSELRYMGDSTMPERISILRLHRRYVLEQQRKWNGYLQNLDEKIQYYEQSIKLQNT
ncbi:MerR family transcriptional regulator [Marvinbryantia formatexigens]|nr:MerR family transcriptional regulator [Marvinbryantia formatexigens]UWO24611.1 MerR family transcriptional regulator [Marvinbryantia formatexigens DSM 14469]SDF15496.1 DNA-binding transcriptional regulator, MerR family [Marvinbryantia formatexigens]